MRARGVSSPAPSAAFARTFRRAAGTTAGPDPLPRRVAEGQSSMARSVPRLPFDLSLVRHVRIPPSTTETTMTDTIVGSSAAILRNLYCLRDLGLIES